jgi:hypothetical protein
MRVVVLGLGAMSALSLPASGEEISIVREVAKCVMQCPQEKGACESYCQCVVSSAHERYTLEEYREIEATVVTDQPVPSHLRAPLQALMARAADCAAGNLTSK